RPASMTGLACGLVCSDSSQLIVLDGVKRAFTQEASPTEKLGPKHASIRLTLYARGVQQTRTRAESQTKFLLEESQLPRRWYNIRADMPTPPQPVLHPGTGQPIGPDDLAPLFPMALICPDGCEESEI